MSDFQYCKACGSYMPIGRLKFCTDACRDSHKTLRTGALHARHTVLIRLLQKERVPKTDKLYSEDFYEQLILGGCIYCEGPLSPSGHGLDRIINSLGHRCWNVVACCSFCNGIKSDQLSFEEMLLLRDGLIAIRELRETPRPKKLFRFRKDEIQSKENPPSGKEQHAK